MNFVCYFHKFPPQISKVISLQSNAKVQLTDKQVIYIAKRYLAGVYKEYEDAFGLFEIIKDGQILCDICNRLIPSSISVSMKKIFFYWVQNHNEFIKFVTNLGFPSQYVYDVNDLSNEQQLLRVAKIIIILEYKTNLPAMNNTDKSAVYNSQLLDEINEVRLNLDSSKLVSTRILHKQEQIVIPA